ncbi:MULTISPECIES: ABC transporter ATP-binding protein [unclassified Corynebacterium]|uniref:Spermidine/putrescine ABC transporter ATP-binding protein n=1 Tax=Corynebacterium minutissimum TaxID=38301 RepID=A0ACC4U8H2_9CORY|nr:MULTISPECIES: ABC transporter ATP-binding protein [unclassified Corynebacterium]KKO77670.1 spermidine/putrescine ABC transporter ATP-binding protein [Corynebacterium minutissimum]OFK66768.1 spermidine/putrescine ABC transporter ATP-binding protein [Corynebacterium sp. HMSC074A09]OFK69454.1 spermidine/putrescine ABC transporter ATP-binding protein [Corynebacterium sp. HMSC076G08]OFQ55299.1 spermidine/putrescine ABC transporter ATP-binding protein [Corynebacterium sp. HMSC074H12]OHO54402.1 sp
MTTSALVLDNVMKTYGDVNAVNGLSFRANYGEILCLLGPNGAGKTTTIEMCEGFKKPTSGRIEVLGLNPARNPDAVRSRIGIMLQGGGSYSGIKVKEMLELSASYNENPLDPEWLLDTLGLRGVAKSSYRRLSGGQQQRLSLALAIIGRPELVFLDEPTAGMDAQSRLAVWDLIRALRADGVTVILTTHLMDEAEALSDRVVIIDHGQLVASGTAASLTDSADVPQVNFDTATPVDLEALRDAGIAAEALRPLHYRLTSEASPAGIAALASCLAAQNVILRNLHTSHRNLEEVFLDLTGRDMRS